MKIVRKINIIQAVTATAFTAMVVAATVLLQGITTFVEELISEDMAVQREAGVMTDAYLRQLVAVERVLRYGSEAGMAEAMAREYAIFEEKAQRLAGAVAGVRALIAERSAAEEDRTSVHGQKLANVSQLLERVAADVDRYEGVAVLAMREMKQGRYAEALALEREAAPFSEALGESLRELEQRLSLSAAATQAGIAKAERTLLIDLIIAAAISIAVALGVGYWIIRSIRASLTVTTERLGHITRHHDLSTRLPESGDELGEMAASINTMLAAFQAICQQLASASSQLAAASEELAAVTEESSTAMARQSSETDQVATAMNQMSASMHEVANNSASALDAVNRASGDSTAGRQVVMASIESIHALAANVSNATGVIQALAQDSQNVGGVLDVIKGIAEQTNLLALNAAIEAARAGEQGRGFAVVADEVRTLAQRTQESIDEIQQTIERLQSQAASAVAVMGESGRRAERGAAEAGKADASLTAINGAVVTISDMMTQIASAAEQQSAVAEEINRSLSAIRDVVAEVNLGAGHTAQASNEIALLATGLQGMVAQFKV